MSELLQSPLRAIETVVRAPFEVTRILARFAVGIATYGMEEPPVAKPGVIAEQREGTAEQVAVAEEPMAEYDCGQQGRRRTSHLRVVAPHHQRHRTAA